MNRPVAIPARISDLVAPLTAEEEREIDAYRSAANDRSVVQISDNPLLREPSRIRHVKPRFLGDWGTTPGLSSIHALLNPIIKKHR